MNNRKVLSKVLKTLTESSKLHSKQQLLYTLSSIDKMEGYEFEKCMKDIYERLGYSVHHTPLAGDQGADLILTSKNGIRTAVQVKRYSSSVSNKAVQEVVAAKAIHTCTKGIVVTNNYFTDSAKQLARANDIDLIDRNGLTKLIDSISTTQTYNFSQNVSDNGDLVKNATLRNTTLANLINNTPQPQYSEQDWVQYIQRYTAVLRTDLEYMKTALENLDYIALSDFIKDTQNAMDANSRYTTSTRLDDAKIEWMAALKDFKSAGVYTLSIPDEEKMDAFNSTETGEKLKALLDSGTAHMNKATALIKNK